MKVPLVDLAAQQAEVDAEVRAGWDEVLKVTAFVGGPQVRAFEDAYAAAIEVSHCVGVANGTDAIELALRAVGVDATGEVILPANTFIATAEAVARIGARPVLVDVDPTFLLIDPDKVAEVATERTQAIVPVHLFGQVAPVEQLEPIAAACGAVIVEDAAQAQGARRHGRYAGGLGRIAATSFYPGKNLGAAGDAGAVTTDDPDLARKVRLLGAHGSEKKYVHETLGFNSRLDTLQAVVLSAKLKRLAEWNDRRRAAAARYGELLADLPGVLVPESMDRNEDVWHLYVIRVHERDRVLDTLHAAGIGAGIHYPDPVHLTPAFAHLGFGEGSFPIAERAARRILSLPLFPHITAEQQDHVVASVQSAVLDRSARTRVSEQTVSDDIQSTPSPATLGQPVVAVASRALGWSLLNTALSRFGTLAIGIVVARLLGPEQFGTFAVAMVALLAVLSFNELGVSLAIVRWPVDPKVIAPTVTTISLATSALITLGGVLAAPWFATAMGAPEATTVVQVMMACVLINGAVATPAALMQREFMQARRMVVDQVNTWLGAFVSIGLVLSGMGAMSLAIGRVAGSLVSGIMFVVWSPRRYEVGFNRVEARGLLRFGLPLAGASMVVFATGYADQLVTGRVLGPTQLGFYVLAFNLASWPVSLFSQPLRSVAPAAFARLQHVPDQMRSTFLSVSGLLAGVALPCCFGIAAAAEPIVRLVYGEQWLPAASALQWLAIFAAVRIMFEMAYDYLVVLGKSGALLRAQVLNLVALVPALILGAHLGGISGVAISQIAVSLIVVLPLYLLEFHRNGIRVRALGRQIWPALAVAGVLGMVVFIAARQISVAFWADVLAGVLTTGAVGLMLYGRRKTIRELRDRTLVAA